MSLESKHIDKTVDFKAINSYKKNVNILNRLGYEDAPEFKELLNFLKQFKLNKADKDIKANITSPNGRYYLPDGEKAGNFFSLLNQCNTKKFALHFREMQITDIENDVGSGIMLDFDIYQESNKNPLETKNCQDFSSATMRCLINMLDCTGKEVVESYVGIIIKPRLVFNKDKNLWKNGFHMLIPNIWLAREQKKMFLQEILNNKECQREFMKLFETPLSSALDMQSASVPVYFVYNCKEDVSEPYVLKDVSIYKSKRNTDDFSVLENSISVVYSNKDTFPSSINRELALSFRGIEQEKIFYKFKQEYAKRLQAKVREEIKYTKELDDSMAVFNHFNSYVDDNLEYYRTLVTEVLDSKRADDRKLWRDTVFAIANINKPFRVAFKEVARQFSMRCPSKYDSESFESLWSQAIDSKSNNSLTYNSIVYWCKEDNPKKFNSILDKDITTIIELDAFSRENFVLNGSLFQYHFAYYIFHLFKQKFAYDVDGKSGKWYEFVIDNDEYKNGEVYKWRHEIKPDNLIIYISNRLPEIVSKVLEKAEIRKASVEDENIVKYIESRSEKLRKSGENLYKTEFKNGVIKEAESLFRRRGFIDSLDEAENVMGVANGVLLLDDDVKFISGYHEHLVSMYSEVAYYPFDLNSKESTILLKMLMNIFPENELDMFHYLMYFLATCLDNRPKDSMFLILQGSGCHALNTKIKMYDGSVKVVQDVKVGDKLMGDDGTERNVQELFRGRDTMYKVKVNGNLNSFVVNENHVLSLKFNNVSSKTVRSDGSVKYFWYESDGINEPKQYSKIYKDDNNVELIKEISNSLKEEDIIDIKIKDLLNWNPYWLENGNVMLYTYGSRVVKKLSFSLEKIGIDDFYGFELDNNHRYLTADYIVHHNSNGKSSLLELAKTILGQYGAKVSMSILTEQRSGSGNANEQLMAYHRGRLAFYSETNKQEEINSAVVKEFTSQESMTGRGIFEKQRTFRPKCNHVVTTNYYPVIKTTDYGIWRRMKLYRHKVSFKPKNKLDPNNKYEKEADENVAKEFSYNKGIKEAFLALLVEYYKDLQKNHGGKLSNIRSESLDRDSLEYRNSMDTLNRFICENVIVSKQSSVSINEIVDAYVDFLTEEYGKSITIQKNELKQLIANSDLNCFQLAEDSIKPVYKGIRLLDTKDDDERMLEGEYFLVKNKNSKNDKEDTDDDEGKYTGKTFDPLGLNDWYKNIMKA